MTTAIMGALSTTAMVSYSTVRSRTRDVARVTDVKQIQVALALHLDSLGGFPGDGRLGATGIRLGEGEFVTLSEGGWAPTARGTIFMLNVPRNPVPFGTHYVYRSLNPDGSDCNDDLCESYAVLFATERPREDLRPGVHAVGPNGFKEPQGFSAEDLRIIGTENNDGLARFDTAVTESAQRVQQFVNDPRVQLANEAVVAPSVAAASAFNTAFASSQVGQYLLLFMTQPAALLGTKRRKKWGTVYNAATRMPVDLAIVRLRNASGKVIKSTVTDVEGRYSFLVPAGSYSLEVAKVGLAFPSALSAGRTEDGVYHDIYTGGLVATEEDGGVLTPNIPVDPTITEKSDVAVIRQESKRRWHNSLALASPVVGAIVLVMRPTLFVGLLFAAEVVAYFLFKRLAQPPEPKNWGTVFDKVTRRPVPQAVVRIFSAKYNKLLEAQVTDGHGRYHFRVMGDNFFMTVTKAGYRKTETNPFDLRDAKAPVVIASDLPLASIASVSAAGRAAPMVGGSALHATGGGTVIPGTHIKPAMPPAGTQPYSPKVSSEAPALPSFLSDHAGAADAVSEQPPEPAAPTEAPTEVPKP